MTGPGDGGLTAALLQLARHTSQLGQVDQREAAHFRDVNDALGKVQRTLKQMGGTLGHHSEILAAFDGLDAAVAKLGEQVATQQVRAVANRAVARHRR